MTYCSVAEFLLPFITFNTNDDFLLEWALVGTLPFSEVLSMLSGEFIAVSLFKSSAGNNLQLSSSTPSSNVMFVSSISFAEWDDDSLFFLGCFGSKIKTSSAEEKQTSALKKQGGEYGNLVRKFLVPLSERKIIKLQN